MEKNDNKKMPKRALILKGGTMRGAFVVGAMETIYKELGTDYFDTIFSTSVGVFEEAFFAAGEDFTMENTWEKYIDGRKLINFWNIFRGRQILNLDYLIGIFQNDTSRLDVVAMKKSYPNLFTFVAEYKTRELALLDLKNGPIFDIMKASSALPFVFTEKIIIDNKRYIDSWTAPAEKFREALKKSLEGYDEVIAISGYKNDKRLEGIKNIIHPSRMPLWYPFDTNKRRIIETIKQGEIDAKKFIFENKLVRKS